MIVALPATRSTAEAARESVRSVLSAAPHLECHVLDVDGVYEPVADERISSLEDVDLPIARIRLTHDHDEFITALVALWASSLLPDDDAVLAIAPGLVLIAPLGEEWNVGETVAAARVRMPVGADAADVSILSTELFRLGGAAKPYRDAVGRLVSDWRTVTRWLDLFIARVPHQVIVDEALVISRHNADARTILGQDDLGALCRDGRPVRALDLSGFDPARPWVFDSRSNTSTGPLLSRNPTLSRLLGSLAYAGASTGDRTAPRPDAKLRREIARAALSRGDDLADVAQDVDSWLLELTPAGERSPSARYLAGIRSGRDDLAKAFPSVPGRDSRRLARWALEHGVDESAYDAALLRRAAEITLAAQPAPEPARTRRPHGVNLVGYLAGEFGLGTSARLLDTALTAAGIPTSTFAVSTNLQSRTTADYRRTSDVRYDTTLLAVNADQTNAVLEAVYDVVARGYRIGMWYWEVESFPATYHDAFTGLDELWVATDFVRDAIAARSPIPVRTVTPPLPQRAPGEAPALPTGYGIPLDRPWFFFAFDYFSTAERKNPLGLIEAFTRAFAPGEGPALVIKTINSSRRVGEAEQVRLRAAERSDIILIDEYLDEEELTALTARCTAYVSLHRAEGLGLTIAEAMAWGKPVVVSAYSGNMQFTNARNAFLVPCSSTPIPPGAEPYPVGTPWAEPDLEVAAAHLRRIVENPAAAAAVGRRAAEDIRTQHSPTAAAERVRAALASSAPDATRNSRRRARSERRPVLTRARLWWRRTVTRS